MDGRRMVVVGASAGIGMVLAQRAVGAGADVVFVGRRRDRLEAAIADAGGGHAVVADIRRPDAAAPLVAEAVAALGGPIDALVFTAGVSGLARLVDTTQDEWLGILETNVVGPSMVTAAAIGHLTPEAVVGFVSSESVGRPRIGLVPYSASKAALEETIRGWRAEHPEVRFCRLCVGATEGTEFARDFDLDRAMAFFPQWVAEGHMPAAMMPVAQVAGALLDVLASALANPAIDLQDAVVRSPGPLMTGAVDAMLDQVAVQNQAGGASAV